MQSARTRVRTRPKAEINVVPYIDVMLVLLVIFIATAPVVMQGVTVDLPQAEAETMNEDQKTPIIATVDKVGQYYVTIDTNNVKMGSLDELTAYVSSELQKDLTRPVVVQGDAQVPYDNVIQLMNALKKSGVKSVGLVTEPVSN
ncbi:MAG: protein TolR [Succinivibrio sp.]|nr:protein TolR [Succinivibrio sp.]MCI5576000.1 protein TolR [Succinivibrio sp.]MCI5638119.1 protein TolR [Succinivibrio sp.]MCI6450089.1 protein TolR [Succinivibrio sp.]MCI7772745.1 protein TolR [Succinivibrio sp.]